MQHPILETTLIVLFAVLAVNLTFRLMRLPIILGYLLVGLLVGPEVIGWIPDTETIQPLAEFGIVLLMFTIGLEFSLSRLFSLKFPVFVLGGMQVFITMFVTTSIGLMVDMTLTQSLIIGAIVAMSSTALVVKMLSEQFEIHSPHGLNAIGILLFQDLAVIPIMTVIASLTAMNDQPLAQFIPFALLKSLLAILIIIGLGRCLLKPLFRLIAATRIVELFTLMVLFIAIGSAWVTAKLGMTLALGAFLSGIMLGETEFRHQIKSEIRPFKDILLGLFFVSIGMLANIQTWLAAWHWILLLLIAIMIGKTLLIIALCRISNYKIDTSIRTGLILSQGGEFGFAIFALAHSAHLLPVDYSQVVLAALLISFAFAPFIIRFNGAITKLIRPDAMKRNKDLMTSDIKSLAGEFSDHVIICGFGRVGQHIGQFLKQSQISFLAFELDPEIIHNTNLAGEPVLYGNATHIDILKTANIKKAAALVISFDDISAALTILSHIKMEGINIPTLVRCRDETEFELLKDHGATKIVTEVYEESLTLVHYLLRLLHIPHGKIHHLLEGAREHDYQMLSRIFPGSFFEEPPDASLISKHLRPVYIAALSNAIDKRIHELEFNEVDIITIIRDKKQLSPEHVKIKEEDILILYGLPSKLDDAEKQLLKGREA